MAYGNWGAFVHRNGERMPKWEDQTPYREGEYEPGYHQAFGIANIGLAADGSAAITKLDREKELGPHHAVLGEKRVRLCGYKCYARLYVDGVARELGEFAVAESDSPWTAKDGEVHHDYKAHAGTLALDGETYMFTAEQFDDNMIDLELVEPDGTKWTSRCGYCYGAGHQE